MNVNPKILVSAYACSPKHGSEEGLGWNWVNQISEKYETWVLLDAVFVPQCLQYLSENGIVKPKLHLIGVKRPGGGQGEIFPPLNYFWLYYITQNLWQRMAFKIAKRLHAVEKFDIVHQLNMIGYREPGYLWQLDETKPFIWGPIGGHAQMPKEFLPFLDLENRLIYGLRNLINDWQMKHSGRVNKAMRRADVLFGATKVDLEAIHRIHKRNAIPLNDTGTTVQISKLPDDKYSDKTRRFELVWAGVFLGRKALPLGLQALARCKMKKPELEVRLTIIGDGACNLRWKKLAFNLGVANLCEWTGWLPHDQAKLRIKSADAMLFTSLQEGTPTVVPEALMYGLPVICHDACGFGDLVTDQCGIKIPMIDPETSINGFANAILTLVQDRQRLVDLAQGALVRANEVSYIKKAQLILNEYQRLLAKS